MKKKIFAAAMAAMTVMAFAGAAYGASSEQRGASGTITEDRAKEIALEHSKVNSEDVRFIFAKTDWEHGTRVYEVEFFASDGSEYDYEINAETGEVEGFDYDAELHYSYDGRMNKETRSGRTERDYLQKASDSTDIGIEEAKKKALDDAGISESEVRNIKAERDYDDGRAKYEIKFLCGTIEYEYEVDAATGAITERDAESIYD